jgi:hypothetical protein
MKTAPPPQYICGQPFHFALRPTQPPILPMPLAARAHRHCRTCLRNAGESLARNRMQERDPLRAATSFVVSKSMAPWQTPHLSKRKPMFWSSAVAFKIKQDERLVLPETSSPPTRSSPANHRYRARPRRHRGSCRRHPRPQRKNKPDFRCLFVMQLDVETFEGDNLPKGSLVYSCA